MTLSQIKSQCTKWDVPYEVYSDAVGRPGSFTPLGFIIHHTGGAFTESDNYLKFLFETGRPAEGIPGQLCNFSGGPSGKIYIGKMTRANHAGRGDWTTRLKVGAENYPGYTQEIKPGPDDYGTGNGLYYGLEINYPGTVPMKNAQWNSAVKLAAAIMDFHKWTALSSIGHREHSIRKWDPGQALLYQFRKDVRDLLRDGPDGEKDWFDMATKAELEAVVKAQINALVPGIVKTQINTLIPGIVDKRVDITDGLINSLDFDFDDTEILDAVAELSGLTELEAQMIKAQLQELFTTSAIWNDLNVSWNVDTTWDEMNVPKLDQIIELLETQ